jgi:hypothetical protein
MLMWLNMCRTKVHINSCTLTTDHSLLTEGFCDTPYGVDDIQEVSHLCQPVEELFSLQHTDANRERRFEGCQAWS